MSELESPEAVGGLPNAGMSPHSRIGHDSEVRLENLIQERMVFSLP